MRFKKLVMFLLTLTLVVSSAFPVMADTKPVRVFYEGKLMNFQVDPVIEKGTTLVQFRPIFETLGLTVGWNQETKTVTGTGEGINISLTLDNPRATVNGSRVNLDIAPKTIDGNTMVPLRFIGEATGREVFWDSGSRTISIVEGYKKLKVSNPYGRDSFIKLEDVNEHSRVNPNIYVDGEYLYVTWYKDIKIQDTTYMQFYVSIAKNGVWEKQAAQMALRAKTPQTTYSIFFAEGSYYIKDSSSIVKLTPTETGGATTEYITNSLPSSASSSRGEVFKPVYVDGKVAVLYRTEDTFKNPITNESIVNTYARVYYEKDDCSCYNNYYELKDVYSIIPSIPNGTSLFYNPNNKILYLLEGTSYRQLDTVTGDLKYGTNGKDLVVHLVEGSSGRGVQLFHYKGETYAFYTDSKTRDYRFARINKNLVLMGTNKLDLQKEDTTGIVAFSYKTDRIDIWRTYEFNRKPSVERVSYER